MAFTLPIFQGVLSLICFLYLNQILTANKDLFLSKTIGFLFFALMYAIMTYLSQQNSMSFGQDIVFELRNDIARKIINTPARVMENGSSSKYQASLSEDIDQISYALNVIPVFGGEIATIFCIIIYVLFISKLAFLISISLICFSLLIYYVISNQSVHQLESARLSIDKMYQSFSGLIFGYKELKINRTLRNVFLEKDIKLSTQEVRKRLSKAYGMFALSGNISIFIVWIVSGLLAASHGFFPNHLDATSAQKLTMAAIYLINPFIAVLNSMPQIKRGYISYQRILELTDNLIAECQELSESTNEFNVYNSAKLESKPIILKNVVFQSEDSFQLGPINLELKPGQITFLNGGNGSGKSTLIKIITGLYPIDRGTITVGNKPVSNKNIDEYRQLFSGVFFDYHLFDRLLVKSDLSFHFDSILDSLRLNNKVTIENDRFTTINLSSGQRRRLALIRSLVEDRPVYFFDEWSADQDPEFKKYFYSEIISKLKAKNKIIIIVTHDIHFLSEADQVIHLDHGKIVPYLV
jgi:putative ATP-binding cassette transporter